MTVVARSIRLQFATGALFILTSGTLQPVTGIAQPADGGLTIWNTWNKVCFDAPYTQPIAGSGSPKLPAASQTVEACYTYAVIRERHYLDLVYIIGMLHVPALNKSILVDISRRPLGSEPGYLLFRDGSRIKLSNLEHDTCDHSWCYARAEVSDDLLERIKAAAALSFGPLPCCGFAEAFAGQPVHPSVHDEMQRKIIEFLVRRFHDFIQ
jgi:invasion protein IalB